MYRWQKAERRWCERSFIFRIVRAGIQLFYSEKKNFTARNKNFYREFNFKFTANSIFKNSIYRKPKCLSILGAFNIAVNWIIENWIRGKFQIEFAVKIYISRGEIIEYRLISHHHHLLNVFFLLGFPKTN